MEFKFHEIETITNNFSDDLKIGSGGYGAVYKGVYNGEEIAVKKFYLLSGLDDKAFDNELRNLSKIHHKNVVRLIGYCSESRHKYVEHEGELVLAREIDHVLCFEYMHGGSLDKHISDEHCDLDWSTCYKIIKGICEGLNHLHNEQEEPIYHLDLKPANIFLDKNMTAKIADFALSRLNSGTRTDAITVVLTGTPGYMPPEYLNDGIISSKFDVFSLGITILKIMAGNTGCLYEMTDIELVTENWKKRLQGTSRYSSQEIEILSVKTCLEIALRCVEADREKRPSLREIINKLEDLDHAIKKMLLLSHLSEDLLGRCKIPNIGLWEGMDFKLPLLEIITNNFSDENKVGSGGYGDVYRGVYNGEEIAVKKFHPLQALDDKAFQNEVRNLWKVRHKNVVGLIGYCSNIQHRFLEHKGELVCAQQIDRVLCFEYMQGGSLDKYISDASCDLDWPTCYKIINGTCEGLNYLHNAQERPIFHLDLKPCKVLLDKDMTAKIAGFGLSRQVDPTETDVRAESIQGTFAYMPPEYINYGCISEKFDMFSLGVTILEILAGNKSHSWSPEMPQELFIEFVTQKWSERLRGPWRSLEIDIQRVKKCAEIALRCVEVDPLRRPSINEITNDLEELENKIKEMSLSSHQSNDLLARKEDKRSNEATSLPQWDQELKMEDVRKELKMLECILGGSKEPSKFKLSTLQFITQKFSRDLKIGYGGCAEVYKGNLGSMIIAVKKISSIHAMDDTMFHQEVTSLMRVNHKNVVRFLGYCSHTEEQALKGSEGKFVMAEIRERLLCFEYMSNGSLENYLTDELRGLEWQTRYQIIKGICDGLDHLHQAHIIHMDLKPANILLDKSMVPKITDFGLARPDDKSQTKSLDRLGTPGYCASEYWHYGKMSTKSDIYGLGVIIQELVTGCRGKPNSTEEVYRRWKHRWNKSATNNAQLWYKQVATCLDLARRCTKKVARHRPDIGNIISNLNEVDSHDDVPLRTATEYLELEDMLGIEPLEIDLPFELNKQTSCSVELTNDTDDHFAFSISTISLRPYLTEANKGILQPRSSCKVTITLQAPEKALLGNRYRGEFSVQSTRVDESLTEMDVCDGDFFKEEAGKVVDTVNVTVVLISEASTSGDH